MTGPPAPGRGPLPGPSVLETPEGDNRRRLVCRDCGYIAYDNPKIVAACVGAWEGQYLLCRRAIEPRRGYWTIPGGYLEARETTAEGALREAREEACCRIELTGLAGIFEIPRVSQIYVVHYGRLAAPEFAPGPESLEVKLFAYEDIPWDEIAFPPAAWGLKQVHNGRPAEGAVSPL